MLKVFYFKMSIEFIIFVCRWIVLMMVNSCVSGLIYKVILLLNFLSMVNMLVIMLDNEIEVSDGNFFLICELYELLMLVWFFELINIYVLFRFIDIIC